MVYHLDAAAGLSSPRARRGLALSGGEIWVATDRALDRIRDGVVVASYDHANTAQVPDGRVTGMATDGLGHTWIATLGGLARIGDGAVLPSFPGLPDRRVLSLLATGGEVLVGTWRGLSRIAPGTARALPAGGGLPDRPVTALLANDSLWVGFADRGLWVGGRSGSFSPAVERWRGTGLSVTTLTDGTGGDVWVGTAGRGLLRWRAATATAESILPSGDVLSALREGDAVWIGTSEGLYRWYDSGLSRPSTPDLEFPVTALVPMGDGAILVGTWGRGLWRCGAGPCEAAGLDGSRVFDVAVVDGTVWVTTASGLAVLADGPAHHAVPGAELRSIHHEHGGGVWVASGNAGFYEFSREGEMTRHYHPSHHLPDASILSLARGTDPDMWVGTSKGLFRFDGEQFVPIPLTDDGGDAVYCLLAGRGGVLWVGTESGLFRRSDQRMTPVPIPDQAATPVVRAVLADDAGVLWVGTDQGLHRRDELGRWRRFGTADGLPSERIRALAQDRDRRLWVATTAGIARYDGKVTAIGPQLPDGPFTCLLVDVRGQVWIGSLADGAWRFDGSRYHHLSTRDGLASNAVWDIFSDSGGAVWLATDRGLARYGRPEVDGR